MIGERQEVLSLKIKKTWGQRTFDIFNLLFIAAFALVMFYPMWHVLMASVSSGERLLGHKGLLLYPLDFNLESFGLVFKNPMIVRGFLNTAQIVVIGVTLNLIFTAVLAYFLTRKDVMWQKLIMVLIVISMYFSGGMIPTYLVVSRSLHLNNSMWALILPGLISTYNLIILRTSFASIPDSLEESAKIDGAGHLRVLANIVVPLSLPALAVMVLYYAVGHWNSWFNANIYLKDRAKYPLQLVLREVLVSNDTSSMTQDAGASSDQMMLSESVKYGVVVVSTIPILLVYPFLQRYFVKGVMVGAVKG